MVKHSAKPIFLVHFTVVSSYEDLISSSLLTLLATDLLLHKLDVIEKCCTLTFSSFLKRFTRKPFYQSLCDENVSASLSIQEKGT
jgi:hypothetical protein